MRNATAIVLVMLLPVLLLAGCNCAPGDDKCIGDQFAIAVYVYLALVLLLMVVVGRHRRRRRECSRAATRIVLTVQPIGVRRNV